MTGDGFKQLVGVAGEILQSTGLLQQKPPLLYHYTDHAGLLGIVSSSELWATNAKFLNDASEVKYGSQLAIPSVKGYIARATWQPWKSALETAEGWLSSSGEISSNIRPEFTDAYVVCFCQEPNLLSQWRAYSRGGGYSIGFDLNVTLSPEPEFEGRQGFKSRVCYNPTEQQSRLDKLLSQVDEKAHALETGALVPSEDQPEPFLVRVMDIVLPSWLYTVKDPSFEDEKEWRLVYLPAVTEEGYAGPKGIHFRPGVIGLLPYIKVRPEGTPPKLAITSVKCGPNVDRNLTEHAVKLLLRKHGYNGVEVSSSSIPVRM